MSSRLRIWLPSIRAGSGTDVFTKRLCAGLTEAGHEAFISWFDPKYEFAPWLLLNKKMPEGTSVVHAGTWQGFGYKREKTPLVLTEHDYSAHPESIPFRSHAQSIYHKHFIQRMVRNSYQAADCVVAVSHFLADRMKIDVGEQIPVIHNWVDLSRFTPNYGVSDSLEGPFNLLFVGNPSKRKGVDVLGKLAARLGPEFMVHCLGGLRDDSNHPELENVRALPRVSPHDMPDLYQSMDAVLVPSRYEAFGYVSIEAMACGLPVLGFRSSGTAEVCVDGETAILVAVDDVDGLVAGAHRLREEPAFYQAVSRAARKRAEKMFGVDRAIQAYVSIYEQAISKYS